MVHWKKKTSMNVILESFVDEFTRLHEEGFISITLFNIEEIRVKLHTILPPVDLVPRTAI